MSLNDLDYRIKDFKHDFEHGHLHLPPSGALISLSPGERRSVFSLYGPASEQPAPALEISRAYAISIVDLGEANPLPRFLSTASRGPRGCRRALIAEREPPGTPTFGISPDALDERAQALARFDTSMAPALALEALDSGANSPPQVGGGPINLLPAFGISVHRQLSFYSDDPYACHDRDLTPAPPPYDELVAAFASNDDPDDFDDGCLFLPGADAGSPPLGFCLPGALVFSIGATELRSVAALRRRDDWALWEPAVRKELDHAFKTKKSLQYRTVRKTRKCAERYARYSSATTLGE